MGNNKVFQPPRKSIIDDKQPKQRKQPKLMHNKLRDKILVNLEPEVKGKVKKFLVDCKKFSLVQMEICSSVTVKDNRITDDTIKYVNQNGNAIPEKLIVEHYKKYIGRAVYKEHQETPDHPFGFVVDSALVIKPLSKQGATTSIQLLIAVDKETAEEIKEGRWKFSSFGMLAETIEVEPNNIELITNLMFYEASLVTIPAYGGATLSILYELKKDLIIEVPEEYLEVPEEDKDYLEPHLAIYKLATPI